MDSAESRKRGLVVAKVARTYPVRPNMMHRNESATTLVDHATRPVATSPTPKRARPDDEVTPKAKLSKEEKASKKARKLEKAEKKAAALLLNESKPPVDRSPILSLEESHETAQTPTLRLTPKDPAEADAFMKANDITIHDSTAQECCTELAAAPFPKPLVDLLTKQGFSKPSAVQGATWPLAMAGRDVLAVAKTGSGKTLGFLVPALSRCHAGRGQSTASRCW